MKLWNNFLNLFSMRSILPQGSHDDTEQEKEDKPNPKEGPGVSSHQDPEEKEATKDNWSSDLEDQQLEGWAHGTKPLRREGEEGSR
jgi:hypothetical protein